MKLSLETTQRLLDESNITVSEEGSLTRYTFEVSGYPQETEVSINKHQENYTGCLKANERETSIDNAKEIFDFIRENYSPKEVTEEDILSALKPKRSPRTPAENIVEALTEVISVLNDKAVENQVKELVNNPTLKLVFIGISSKLKAFANLLK